MAGAAAGAAANSAGCGGPLLKEGEIVPEGLRVKGAPKRRPACLQRDGIELILVENAHPGREW